MGKVVSSPAYLFTQGLIIPHPTQSLALWTLHHYICTLPLVIKYFNILSHQLYWASLSCKLIRCHSEFKLCALNDCLLTLEPPLIQPSTYCLINRTASVRQYGGNMRGYSNECIGGKVKEQQRLNYSVK